MAYDVRKVEGISLAFSKRIAEEKLPVHSVIELADHIQALDKSLSGELVFWITHRFCRKQNNEYSIRTLDEIVSRVFPAVIKFNMTNLGT